MGHKSEYASQDDMTMDAFCSWEVEGMIGIINEIADEHLVNR